MTREEAISIVTDKYTDGVQNRDVINEIYDDFESRTCENCKYFLDEEGTSMQFCNARTEGGVIGWNAYGKDFGCNRFSCK